MSSLLCGATIAFDLAVVAYKLVIYAHLVTFIAVLSLFVIHYKMNLFISIAYHIEFVVFCVT